MKKKFMLIAAITTLCLTGCSSISKEEYDAKLKELESVQQELSEVKNEYLAYKTKTAEKEMSTSGAHAWVETAFGEKAQTIVNENDLYVNIPVGYTLSEKSIESLMNKILSGLKLYSTYYQTNPDQLPYDSVTIIVLEENTKLDMLSIQLIRNSDGTFQNATMINMTDFTTILPYINKALD